MKHKDLSKDASKIFDQMSESYQSKYMNVDKYAKFLTLFCDLISPINASIFEVACGPGNVTKFILTQNPKLKITSTDMSSNMIALAKKNNPSIEAYTFDMRKLDLIPQKFNGIVSSFGLPYLNKDESFKFLASVYKRLFDGGALYLSATQGDYEDSKFNSSSSNPNVKMFIHLYDKEKVKSNLISIGFKIEMCESIQYENQSGDSVEEFVILATK